MSSSQIYTRQTGLPINIPRSITIVGCGGVGSWVAMYAGMVGIQTIALIDDDVVEEHNLNRTPYKTYHIGDLKVFAAKDLIQERRPGLNVIVYPEKWETLPGAVRDTLTQSTHVIDCRDSIEPLVGVKKTPITGGYNGLKGTIHTNPDLESVFGSEDVRYTITPSYLVPPSFIALMIINAITVNGALSKKEQMISFDCTKILNTLAAGEQV